MKNYPYEYKRPEGKLYKISIRKWNEVFAKRGRFPFASVYAYIADDKAIIEVRPNLLAKICTVLAFPILVLIIGFSEALKESKMVIFPQHYGSFAVDLIYKTKGTDWKILETLIK
jgi:hypothetical protein